MAVSVAAVATARVWGDELERAMIEALPYDAAAKYAVVPVRFDGEVLVVEVGPQSDLAGAQLATKTRLKPVMHNEPSWREQVRPRLHDLYTMRADRRALARVRPPVAIKFDVLPIAIIEGLEPTLVVAMGDSGATKVEAVRAHARMALKIVDVDLDTIRKSIRLAYRLNDMLESRAQRARRAPVKQQFDDLVLEAFDQGGQNLFLEPTPEGGQARFGIDGVKHLRYSYSKEEYERMVTAVFNQAVGRGSEDEVGEGQFSVSTHLKQLYLRVVMMDEAFCAGRQASIRIHDLDTQPMTFAESGLTGDAADQLELALEQKSGAYVIVGPGDSGKTMTAVAIFRRFPLDKMKVLGVGDPPEFYVPYIWQTALNPKRPYKRIIEAFLRSSADGFLAGEVRAGETAAEVFDAAQSGGIVALTTHADNPLVAVNRLSKHVDRTTLAGIVRAIVGQRLLRRLCIVCRVASDAKLKDGRSEKFKVSRTKVGNEEVFGCAACGWTGYAGRIGVFEVLRFNKAVAYAVERGVGPMHLAEVASKYGYKPLIHDAYDKVVAGVTDLAEVERVLCTVEDDSLAEDLV